MSIQAIQNGLHRFPELDRLQPINTRKYKAIEELQAAPSIPLEQYLQFSGLGQLIGRNIHRLSTAERDEVCAFLFSLYAAMRDKCFDPEKSSLEAPLALLRMAEQQEVALCSLLVEIYDHFAMAQQAFRNPEREVVAPSIPVEMLYTLFIPVDYIRSLAEPESFHHAT